MNDVWSLFASKWQLDLKAVRTRVYRAPTPRERERLQALWLLAKGWSAAEVAGALERDSHTIGDQQCFDDELSRSTCLNYLQRLGFVLKRPKKRLVKASAEKRADSVESYAALRAEAETVGSKIFFLDEAHFRAEADLCGKWVLRSEPGLVESTRPALHEKAT